MKRLLLTSVEITPLPKILQKEPQQIKMAYVTTASNPDEDKWYIDEDRRKLRKTGFDFFEVDIAGKPKKKLEEIFKNIDVLFISGGNTFYMLRETRKKGFDKIVEKLVNSGVVYVGASAGAVLAGPDIEPIRLLDEPEKARGLNSTKGLSLVDFIPLPHYGKAKYAEKYKKIMEDWSGGPYKLVPITDEQAIVVEDDRHRIVEVR